MRVPTRDELATIFKDPRLVVAIEALFRQASTSMTNDEVEVAISNAQSSADLSLALLEDIGNKLDMVALSGDSNLALALLAKANHKLDIIALEPEETFSDEEAYNNSVMTWISVA